jgi:hypothetical protein
VTEPVDAEQPIDPGMPGDPGAASEPVDPALRNPRRRRISSIREAAGEPVPLDVTADGAPAGDASTFEAAASDSAAAAGAATGGRGRRGGRSRGVDPHGGRADRISDVPELSVEDVEQRIGARQREARRRPDVVVPVGPRPIASRRAILWRDSATILIFVVVALLAARFLLPSSNDSATSTPTPLGSPVAVGSVGPTGINFSPAPTFGEVVNPSLDINASPTPIPVITLPPFSVPDPPTDVGVIRGNQSVKVSWKAPAFNGFASIKGYTATAHPGDAHCSSTGPLSCVISHLKNGTTYTVTVTAYNRIGTSAPSAPSKSFTPAAVPGAPATVTAAPLVNGARITWSAAATNGTPIKSYSVTDGAGHGCSTTGALSCDVGSLLSTSTYTFTVTATNSVGPGLPGTSNPVTPLAAPIAPGAPTSLVATRGNTQVVLDWAPPLSDGGSPITSYTVTVSPSGSCTPATPTSTTCTATGLTNGQPYTFMVHASNAVGPGPDASTSATPATVPGAPTSPTSAVGANPGEIDVTFSAPASDGGSAITSYTVTGDNGGSCTVTSPVGSGPFTCTVQNLSNVTLYTFTVTATNAVGTGVASAATSPAISPT